MIQLVLLLLLAVVFGAVLYFFARKPGIRAEDGADAIVSARQALNSLQGNLLPPELVHRIFAREDLEFVSSIGSKTVREAFMRERRSVALRWVGQVRKQVLNLRYFHSGHSRFYAQLSPRTELELALTFASLLLACRLLETVFYIRGPFAAPKTVARMIGAAGNICAASERSLAFLSATGHTASPDLYSGSQSGGVTA